MKKKKIKVSPMSEIKAWEWVVIVLVIATAITMIF